MRATVLPGAPTQADPADPLVLKLGRETSGFPVDVNHRGPPSGVFVCVGIYERPSLNSMIHPHLENSLAEGPRAWKVSLLTALLLVLVWSACFFFPIVWTATGIGEADKLFLDLRNILSAGELAQQGLDPFLKNPLDPYNRLHGYTEWWFVTGAVGLTLADTTWVGSLLLGMTLAATLLVLRPATWREGRSLFFVLVSPPLLLAINRANPDLPVFVLLGIALVCFRGETAPRRALGVVLLAAAAVLKYFPLAAVVLLLDARSRRELIGWVGLYLFVLVLAWPSLARGWQVATSHQPAPSWLYAFGAPVLFRDFDLPVPLGWLAAAFMLVTAGLIKSMVRNEQTPPAEGAVRDWEREFAGGAVMVIGCFLHGSSYIYKLIFALWMLPLFWRETVTGTDARWRRATVVLLFAVLWIEGGMATIINLSVFAATLSIPAAEAWLKLTLAINQLLTFALVICLWRQLLGYLLRKTLTQLAHFGLWNERFPKF